MWWTPRPPTPTVPASTPDRSDSRPVEFLHRAATHGLTSGLVPAYVSSPELTFGFLFALEDPERIAEVVRGLMERKTVSVFRLARLSDDAGPPERYVVNWAAIPQISITTDAPEVDVLRAGRVMLVNAFLGQGGEIRLYSAEGRAPE